MRTHTLLATSLMFGLVGCMIGCSMAPKYTRPKAPVAEGFEGSKSELPAADIRWQDYFTDPGLKVVIDLALANNRDLRVSSLNVEKAQTAYRIQRSELLPSIGVMGSGSKSRSPERMNGGTAKINESYSVQVGLMSWEVDFFGRLQSLKDRALAQYLATEQAQVAARMSLVSTVAQAWLATAADQENLKLAERTFEAQKTYAELIGQSREVGIASDLDLNQARSQMEAARADVARYRGQVAVDLHSLEVLVGVRIPVEALPKGLEGVSELKDVSAGLSSSVLLRRPDILSAEYQLQAANANIGAARAAFFPRVSLTAGVGTLSPDVSGLFGSGTRTWSFAPQIVAPLFAGGSLWASLKVSTLDREIAVAQYEKAIQSAFREVADGLTRRETLVEQLDAQRSLVNSLETAYRLSESRYKEGIDGYLGVLVAQRSLYVAQQGLVATRLSQQVNQIGLYKALAGSM